ncbi:hypothetical protein [Nonomuraea sp. SYSU D8015]|uniref:hypothetical protein n=1 Tax=Nonomuraea sp. SYSU D8015 TaxID=2593644 RepID=UPI0016613796|nr:hypothetical protein [Nonomuraea sp. SYSU D8015]
MRTPPHLPGRARHESTDTAVHSRRPRRHPYGLHEVPVQSPPRAGSGTLDLPEPAPVPEPDVYVEQRLLGIRELSNQAIGSIDDLLQHTA